MIRVAQTQVAHFTLQKNYLAAKKASNPRQLVKELGGLPSPATATPFLAAQARLEQFQPEQLLTALYQERSLIKAELMRAGRYVVPVEAYPALHRATWRQRNQALNAEFRLWGMENSEVEGLSEAILTVIGNEPLSAEAITARLPAGSVRELRQTSRGGRVSTTSNVNLALRWLAAKGVLHASQTMPAGPAEWHTEKLTYAPLRHWYPDLDLSSAPDEAEAQTMLVRSYLAAFGPATEADISFWTGFGKSETARAVGALSRETSLAMVEGIPGMLLLLKTQAEALQATEAPAGPVINLLPAGDPFTTAHRASRSRYFSDPSLQRQVFNSTGAANPTILINGQIVGVWEWQTGAKQDKIAWRLLAEIDPALIPLIQTELERLVTFIQPDTLVEQIRD